MPSDPERRKRVHEAVTWLREQPVELDGQSMPFDSRAELLGYIAERCRAEGIDEAEIVEIVLTASAEPKEDLIEAEAVLAPLGYTAVSAVLRRLARRAPPRPPTRWERRVTDGSLLSPATVSANTVPTRFAVATAVD